MSDSWQTIAVAIAEGRGSELPPEFREPKQAADNIRSVLDLLGRGSAAIAATAVLLELACHSPAPAAALNNFERLLSNADNIYSASYFTRDVVAVAVTVFSYSQYLADVLIRNPELLAWLILPEVYRKRRTRETYHTLAAEATTDCKSSDERKNALCRFKHREYLRLGTRDFMQLSTVEETTREISDLAESIIAAAAEIAYRETVARFGEPIADSSMAEGRVAHMCVLGMGKLGGRELNFASDIDLVFIYDSEGETTGRISSGRVTARQTNHVFFTRMGETLVRFLSQRGPEGNLFRVDMRLRPEGETGPLARSLESFDNYLVQQARDWERLAYLKARVLSGPSLLADRIYSFTEQFAFSNTSPERIIREVEKLKFMIDREVITSDVYHREVKRGYGGIREIEFVIATMQIVYGRVHRALHVRNIFVGIHRLQQVTLLSDREAAFYFFAYEFLRMIEHRLQIAEERQTHTISLEPAKLDILARQTGFTDGQSFLKKYKEVTDEVHARFVRFFEQDVTQIDRETQNLLTILNRDATEEQALAALSQFELNSPAMLPLIRDLAYGTREVFITAEGQRFFEQMLPSLLRLIPRSPAPDFVLPRLHSFMLAVKGITYYYELIAEHPDILKLIVVLFGTSEYFSRAITAHPEFFDALISSHVLYEMRQRDEIKQRLTLAINSRKAFEQRLVMFRRAAIFENLLVALRYLLELTPLPQTFADLSSTADECVRSGIELAAQRLADRYGGESRTIHEFLLNHISVIALGKYGGNELSFFGDADVVFIHDDSTNVLPPAGEGVPANDFFQAASDAISFVLNEQMQEGRVLMLDARLRPHGKNSPVSTGISQYEAYLLNEAETWELQSHTRARHIAGQPAFLIRLQQALKCRIHSLDLFALRQEISAMRERLERTESGNRTIEFKRSPGGLMDIEFALQFLVLSGQAPASTISVNYFDFLGALVHESGSESLSKLREGYIFLRRLDAACRLLSSKGESVLPEDAILMLAVARQLNMISTEELIQKLNRQMEDNRRAYLNIIGASG